MKTTWNIQTNDKGEWIGLEMSELMTAKEAILRYPEKKKFIQHLINKYKNPRKSNY